MKKITIPTVKLIWCTPDPRRIVAIAGRMTYSDRSVDQLTEGLTEKEIATTINAVLERRHLSVLRHVVFMFSISGVSRAFSHQLVRHTIGHAYEQRSQHYRTEVDPAIVEPESIHENEPAATIYEVAMQGAQVSYEALMQAGIPKDDARFVLPTGVETTLVWTANLEALLNFIQARACRVNTPEIMAVAIATRRLVLEQFPEMKNYLGPTCYTRGTCFEGKKFYTNCMKPWKTPTVLWTPRFPLEIELVGVGGSLKIIDADKMIDDDKHKLIPFIPENYP